jgi:hypothetical protein
MSVVSLMEKIEELHPLRVRNEDFSNILEDLM